MSSESAAPQLPSPPFRSAAEAIAAAERRLADLATADMPETIQWAESALAEWSPLNSDAAAAQAVHTLLVLRARALFELGTPASLTAAWPAFDDALASAARQGEPPTPAGINQTASLWMKRGITLLRLEDSRHLPDAVASFDRAIELRSRLDLRGNPWYRWVLAAGWMNRADALTRLGTPAQIREALDNYDLAIAHLQILPWPREPRFRWRLAVAWLNRGLTCHVAGASHSPDQALRAFDNCIALYREAASPDLDDRRTLAAAWFNRANTLLQIDPPPSREIRAAATNALRLTAPGGDPGPAGPPPSEATDQPLAEIGLKARHVLCAALAQLLEAPDPVRHEADAWILEATDAAEDSLRLARQWEARGESRFRPFLEQMFHFGARVYRAFQPHFLAEFLRDGQASVFTEAMHHSAREALIQAAAQIRGEGLSRHNPGSLQKLLGTLATLNEAAEQLPAPPGK